MKVTPVNRLKTMASVDGSETEVEKQKPAQPPPMHVRYGKNTKNSDTRKIAVVILKLEQYRFTTKSWVQKMQTEWQTV